MPVTFACDEDLWLKVAGQTFRRFYTDPRVHLDVQIKGRLWFRRHVLDDSPPESPDVWPVSVVRWMKENEFFGCPVEYQQDNYAWGRPLLLERDEMLRHIADIDPEERVAAGETFKFYRRIVALAGGMTVEGRPVKVEHPGGGTDGIFTKATEIRGPDRICLDMYESPDFVDELLRLITEKTIGRIRAWERLTGGREDSRPSTKPFHFCDDSIEMISAEHYERFVLPHHERLYAAMTTGSRHMHLCGRASQHYPILCKKLHVSRIDGPGPFVDHGEFLDRLGPDFHFVAQTDNAVLQQGPVEQIEAMVRNLLSPEAKRPGRFQIMGFVMRSTPLRHVEACYQAARRFGAIDPTGGNG